MYQEYFGFKTEPFSISPDPRFLFMSEQHREALAHLLFGMKSDGGFVLLTGEVGTGKTTICRCLLEQLPEQSEVALLLNPKLTAAELLAAICDELNIQYPAGSSSIKILVDAINAFLLDAYSRGRHSVVIIDEAQNLQAEVLEQIRLLTNLETNTAKLLQIIMLGQPELKEMLNRPELLQLAQRITARFHLGPLSPEEVGDYVRHRLSVAGVERAIFTPSAIRKLYRLSHGVPRVINVLCSRALLGAYVRGDHTVGPGLLATAAKEVLGEEPQGASFRMRFGWVGWLLLALVLVGGGAVLGTTLYRALLPAKVVALAQPEDAPPAADPFEWVKALSRADSETLAYQALFGQWGISYSPDSGVSPTDMAAEHGLALMKEQGNFSRMRGLDRPVLLKLTDDQGEDFYATLAALDGDMATLRTGTEQRSVAIRDLIRQWFGEFSLLWQPPPGYKVVISFGARGPAVQWLARQMDVLHGRPYFAETEPVYRGQLFQEVQAFQAAEGLTADGLVGPLTLIHLNTRTRSGQPHLSDPPKE